MASPTPNKGYTYPAHGGAVNAWDSPLNTNFDYIDLNVGGNYDVTLSSTTAAVTYNSSNVTAPSTVSILTPASSIAQNLIWNVTGTLGANLQLRFPTSGGIYVVRNNITAGTSAFTVQARTAAGGGTGPLINPGLVGTVISDGTNAHIANTNAQARVYTFTGDPNGLVAGTAGTADGSLTDVIWDTDNKQLYANVLTGTSSTAVWQATMARPESQGILTVRNSVTFPVLVSNASGVSTVYYTPYVGNWTVLSNGTTIYPYQFDRLTLTLNNPNHLASNIYDVFLYHNSTAGIPSPVIGTGPTWAAAGGSVAVGSCARGTGAGSTELTRLQNFGRILVNANQITLRNDVTTYTVPTAEGIYLGSILIDATPGQVTCTFGVGQFRKWGVWNYYNRNPILLSANDSTASWTYNTNTYRASNADGGNQAVAFCGIDEEVLRADFTQLITAAANGTGTIAIGENSTTTPSGLIGVGDFDSAGNFGSNITATLITAPKLGIWRFNCIEKTNGITVTYNGGSNMQLTVQYRG